MALVNFASVTRLVSKVSVACFLAKLALHALTPLICFKVVVIDLAQLSQVIPEIENV